MCRDNQILTKASFVYMLVSSLAILLSEEKKQEETWRVIHQNRFVIAFHDRNLSSSFFAVVQSVHSVITLLSCSIQSINFFSLSRIILPSLVCLMTCTSKSWWENNDNNTSITRRRRLTHLMSWTAWITMTVTPFETLSKKLMAPKTKAPLDCQDKVKKVVINTMFARI